MKLVKAMLTMGALTMLSRVVGLVRDILTAKYVGVGMVADAFFVALKLPNFFRRVTAEGAFSVSFIPIYSKSMTQEGEDAAARFAGNAVTWMSVILAPCILIFMVFMPVVIHLIAPGFGTGATDGGAQFDLAVALSRISFPYLFFMSLTALFGGMLNAHDKFGPFAAAPILFNGCLVLALLIGTHFTTVGYAMAWAVSISGLLQMLMMLWFMRRYRIKFTLRRPVLDDKIRHLGRLMGPGILGAGIVQINMFADMIIASFLAAGSISSLYYADRLNQLPLGVIGVAIGTALLPMLSRAVSAGEREEAQRLFNRALEICFLLALPAAVALLVIPAPVIHVLFERGEFTSQDTLRVSHVLMGYALGLPAYVSLKVLASISWADHDTITPVKMAAISTITNIVLALTLSPFLGVAGIALGTGIVGWLQFALMWRANRDKKAAQLDDRSHRNFPIIFCASALMAILLLLLSTMLHDQLYASSTGVATLALAGLVAAGGGCYFAVIFGLGVMRLSDIRQFLTRQPKAAAVHVI
ncbi:MAG: murein biosynthesis integral membrane protein MurJ [Pseudomonadota bacterium]